MAQNAVKSEKKCIDSFYRHVDRLIFSMLLKINGPKICNVLVKRKYKKYFVGECTYFYTFISY